MSRHEGADQATAALVGQQQLLLLLLEEGSASAEEADLLPRANVLASTVVGEELASFVAPPAPRRTGKVGTGGAGLHVRE